MKIIRWLDDNLEEALLIALLVTMTLLMGLQVFSRYILNASLSWSEELTRYLFIWSGFLRFYDRIIHYHNFIRHSQRFLLVMSNQNSGDSQFFLDSPYFGTKLYTNLCI